MVNSSRHRLQYSGKNNFNCITGELVHVAKLNKYVYIQHRNESLMCFQMLNRKKQPLKFFQNNIESQNSYHRVQLCGESYVGKNHWDNRSKIRYRGVKKAARIRSELLSRNLKMKMSKNIFQHQSRQIKMIPIFQNLILLEYNDCEDISVFL